MHMALSAQYIICRKCAMNYSTRGHFNIFTFMHFGEKKDPQVDGTIQMLVRFEQEFELAGKLVRGL